jgi:hypothetical protein
MGREKFGRLWVGVCVSLQAGDPGLLEDRRKRPGCWYGERGRLTVGPTLCRLVADLLFLPRSLDG